MNIEFIYFDVGGVVVLDYSKTNKWDEMMNGLGLEGESRKQFEELFDEEEPKFCRGGDVDALIPILRSEYGLELDDNYSMLVDFVSRFERNRSLEPIIRDLLDTYPVGLLTNMYQGMLNKIREHNLLLDIEWKNIVDSSIVGYLKPESEIYELAAQQVNVDPQHILFVENSQMHVDGAKEMGWQTLLYDPSDVEQSNNQFLKYLER